MPLNKHLKPGLIILLLSLLAWLLWLLEITQVKGWYGLDWLYSPLYTPYLIALLPVLAFFVPFIVRKQVPFSVRLIILVLLLYLINRICYYTGYWICSAFYSRLFIFGSGWLIALLLIGLATFLVSGFSYWAAIVFITRKKLKWYFGIILAALSLAVIPLSLLTVYFIPGIGSGDDWVDAVKMGYPCFWITFLYGLGALILSEKQ